MNTQFTFTDYKKFGDTTYCDIYTFTVSDFIFHVHVQHFSVDTKAGLGTTNFRATIVVINEDKTIDWDKRMGSTNTGYSFDDPWISEPAKEYAERIVRLMAFW